MFVASQSLFTRSLVYSSKTSRAPVAPFAKRIFCAPTSPPKLDMSRVSTCNELTGYKIVEQLGVVYGISVRSRNIFSGLYASWEIMRGGKITTFTDLVNQSREEAFEEMAKKATERGANAIVGMRYDTNEIADGVTEMLAYGTAVKVEE